MTALFWGTARLRRSGRRELHARDQQPAWVQILVQLGLEVLRAGGQVVLDADLRCQFRDALAQQFGDAVDDGLGTGSVHHLEIHAAVQGGGVGARGRHADLNHVAGQVDLVQDAFEQRQGQVDAGSEGPDAAADAAQGIGMSLGYPLDGRDGNRAERRHNGYDQIRGQHTSLYSRGYV